MQQSDSDRLRDEQPLQREQPLGGVDGLLGDRVFIAANPLAGRRSGREGVERLADLLRSRGFHVERQTDLARLSTDVAASLAAGTLRAVVAAGGDGTAAAAVNATPPGAPLAVYPQGTENLLSRYLGVRPDPQQIADLVDSGRPVPYDVGRADGRLFLLMFSCGFDAEVVRRVHENRQGHIAHTTYIKPIYESLRSYPYPQITVRIDDDDGPGDEQRSDDPELLSEPAELTGRWAFVVNLPMYAGGLRISPAALGDDGLLDVCTFRHGSLWHGLLYLSRVLRGQHQQFDDCQTALARKLHVSSSAPVPYQLDGDAGGYLPAEIDVLPGRMLLLRPGE